LLPEHSGLQIYSSVSLIQGYSRLDTTETAFVPVDNVRLANMCGALDINLKEIGQELNIKIIRRGETFSLIGDSANIKIGVDTLALLYKSSRRPLDTEDLQLGIVEITRSTNSEGKDNVTLRTRRHDLRGRTPRQTQYLSQIQSHDITFGIGPAGTGKTYLAVASAVDAFERGNVKRIVLVRPAVEAGERLGFLPGDMAQKVDPYLRPLYDALYDLMGYEKVGKVFERSAIEIAPLAYMRGRTLNDAFIILDEAQNTTPEQMKMFLTRMGFGSRAVVTGDSTQTDLPKGQKSGLDEAAKILNNVKGIAFTHFESEDVVRHPLVQRIVNAYAAARSDD
jgi:phosphate starvation-inducible PhoH-like protein